MARTTIWVRPGPEDVHYAGPYGTQNGSDYDNAVPGLKNVPWQTPELEVVVADAHLKIWRTYGNIAGHAMIAPKSGIEGVPTIIRGDASKLNARAKDALILGVFRDAYAPAWTERADLGPGVWSTTQSYHGGGNGWWLRMTGDGTDLADYVPMPPARDLNDLIVTEDSHWPRDMKPGDTVYVHVAPDVDPNRSVFRGGYGYNFNLTAQHYIIFYGITYAGSQFGGGSKDYHDVEYRRCRFMYFGFAFALRDHFSNLTWHRCQLQHGSNGIYFVSVTANIGINTHIAGCHVSDLATEWWNEQPSDGHAFACQGCDGFYVDGCATERTGHPIVCYAWSNNLKQRRVQITRTVVRDAHGHYNAGGWNGIALNPQRGSDRDWNDWTADSVAGCKYERCVVSGAGFGDTLRNGMTLDAGPGEALRIIDCLVECPHPRGVAVAVLNNNFPDKVPTVYMRGNTFRGPGGAFISTNVWGTKSKEYLHRKGGIDSDRNTFIQVGNRPAHFFAGSPGQHMKFWQWQAASRLFDPNSTLKEE